MFAAPTHAPVAAAVPITSFSFGPEVGDDVITVKSDLDTPKKKKAPAAPRRNFEAMEAKIETLEIAKRMWERRSRHMQRRYEGSRTNQINVLSAAVAQQTGQSGPEALYNLLVMQLQTQQKRFEGFAGEQLAAQLPHILTSDEIRQQTISAAAASGTTVTEAQIESNVSMNVQRRDKALSDGWRIDLSPRMPTVPIMKDMFFEMEEILLDWRIDVANAELSLPAIQPGDQVTWLQQLIAQQKRSLVVMAAGVALLLRNSNKE